MGLEKIFAWYPYETYHIIMIVFFTCLSIGMGFLGHHYKGNKKAIFWTNFAFGTFMIVIELAKQIRPLVLRQDYPMSIFPFLFCSMPIYISLIATIVKNDKFRNACYQFLALFSLLAGLVVMVYPGDVLGEYALFSLLHTMLWHGAMISLGVFLFSATGTADTFKNVNRGFLVFVSLVLIATIGNVIIHFTWSDGPNLFLLSPYHTIPLVVFNQIQASFGWFAAVLAYLAAFYIGSSLLWGVGRIIKIINQKVIKHQKPQYKTG